MRHIPNVLSAFRIALIPFFVYQVLAGNMVPAAIILIVSALTDLLDGFLARKFNWVTNLGKVLDPAADKLTQLTICILFVIHFPQYWVFFALLVLREIVMLCFGGYLLKNKVQLSGARWFGKVSTTVFYIAMIFITLFATLPTAIVFSLLILATITAAISTFMYIPEFVRHKRQVKDVDE